MSHYRVMVIGEDVESILAPYDENLEVPKHIDRTKEKIHREFVRYYGRLIAENKPVSDLEKFEKLTLSLDDVNEEWCKGWCGQTLDEDGNTLTTYNQDSKWDWYEIGGRWSGSFILKPGMNGKMGMRSLWNADKEIPSDHVDQALKCEIDWDEMNENDKMRAGIDWDDLFNPNPDACMWRPEYVAKQQKIHLEMYGTKEEYVKRRGIWTPYAVVTEDGWHAPGDMGWWGMSSDETEDRDKFDQEFQRLLADQPDDAITTMVDCHI